MTQTSKLVKEPSRFLRLLRVFSILAFALNAAFNIWSYIVRPALIETGGPGVNFRPFLIDNLLPLLLVLLIWFWKKVNLSIVLLLSAIGLGWFVSIVLIIAAPFFGTRVFTDFFNRWQERVFNSPADFSYSYKFICSNCHQEVPPKFATGQRCPNCGVFWS
jgi:hypothetical protein